MRRKCVVVSNIKDVAKRAGVSISTVSYVMSGKRSVRQETKCKVMRAARDLGYFPNAGARMLRGERTNILALSSPMHKYTDYTNYSAFFFAVAQRAKHYGYDLLLLMGEDETEDLMRMGDSGLVDGILLLDVTLEDPRIACAKSCRVPMVSIGVPADTSNLYCVDLDFELMGRWAVRRAYELGHRHVLFLGDREAAYDNGSNFVIRLRDSVFAAASEYGIAVDFCVSRGGSAAEVRESLNRVFAAARTPTAIFGQCNLGELGQVAEYLREHGLRIPEDVSLLAIGTYGNAASLAPPLDEIPMLPFTTCPKAVDVLVDIIEGRREMGGGVELLPSKYLQRGSMGLVADFL